MGIVAKQSIYNLISIGLAFLIGAVNMLFLYPTFPGREFQGLIVALLANSNLIQPFLSFGVQHTLIKFFSESLTFDNINKNDKQDWISFTMIFLSSFCIVFFMNILLNLSIPDLSPVFYYLGTTLIIFPIINLSFDFIFFITRLLKS